MYVLEPAAFDKPEDMTPEQQAVSAEHFEYLKKLHADGVLVVAGRTDGAEMGIVVFESEDEAAARTLMAADPAVAKGLMRARLYPYRLALLRGE